MNLEPETKAPKPPVRQVAHHNDRRAGLSFIGVPASWRARWGDRFREDRPITLGAEGVVVGGVLRQISASTRRVRM